MPNIDSLIPDIYKTLEQGTNMYSVQNRESL